MLLTSSQLKHNVRTAMPLKGRQCKGFRQVSSGMKKWGLKWGMFVATQDGWQEQLAGHCINDYDTS